MAFEVFKLIHEKEITDILWREDKEAFIELLKKAYEDGETEYSIELNNALNRIIHVEKMKEE